MMTRHEAASIIGIEYFPPCPAFAPPLTSHSPKDVKQWTYFLCSEQMMTRRKLAERYKKVMLLNHPDRGGSPYLAMKINEARRVLMRYCR